jgi:4-hydroxy-tetrahydrodipicolinate synthase
LEEDLPDFTGAAVGSPTPFTGNDQVNEDEYRRHVEFMVQAGVRYMMPIGIAGQGPQLSDAERRRVVELTVQQAAGRAQVFPMCYLPAGTKNTAAFINQLEDLGVDGAYIPAPLIWKSGPEAIYQHYRTILGATHVPIIVYSCPGTTGSRLPSDVVLRLLDEFPGRILGYKQQLLDEVTVDVQRLAHRITVAGPAFFDQHLLTNLQLGCRAQISASCGMVPAAVVQVMNQWDSGDVSGATEIFNRYLPFFLLPTREPSLASHNDYQSALYFHILNRIGFEFGRPRLPNLWPLPPAFAKTVDQELEKLELSSQAVPA